ncbi:MAG: peroxiredoxin family protein [Thermoguttaceae bacterium]
MAKGLCKSLAVVFTVGCAIFWLGCRKEQKSDQSKTAEVKHKSMADTWTNSSAQRQETITAEKAKPIGRAKQPTPPPPLTIPKVGLTDALRETCLVFVGDEMPTGTVLSSGGEKVSLPSHYGEKLTVLFFWTKGATPYAQQLLHSALRDLQTAVAEPFQTKGVKLIGIFLGSPQTADTQLEESGAKFANYFDPEGSFFTQVAKEKLPRIYLLDHSGKILWFDTEYSRSSQRNLLQAIKVALGAKQPPSQ